LEIALIDAVPPALGMVFPIITSDDTISGTFDSLAYVSGPAFGTERQWFVRYEPNSVSLLVTIPGDFNGDGSVDAADYATWRDGLGSTYTQAHYNTWRAHFGRTSGAGATGSASAFDAVPEPATLLTLAIFAVNLPISWRNLARRPGPCH
jgi:hypothetical protein